jgi:uncharacterized membrane protein
MGAARTGGLPPPGSTDRLIGRIEAAERLDGPARLLETAISRPAQIAGTPARRIGDALHGTWFGHPIHPMLVTLPIGAWTLAVGLDLLGRLGLAPRPAADRTTRIALKAGVAGAVASAATGLADWQHVNDRARRVGLVHAAANGTGLALMLLSLGLRARDRLARNSHQGTPGVGVRPVMVMPRRVEIARSAGAAGGRRARPSPPAGRRFSGAIAAVRCPCRQGAAAVKRACARANAS